MFQNGQVRDLLNWSKDMVGISWRTSVKTGTMISLTLKNQQDMSQNVYSNLSSMISLRQTTSMMNKEKLKRRKNHNENKREEQ